MGSAEDAEAGEVPEGGEVAEPATELTARAPRISSVHEQKVNARICPTFCARAATGTEAPCKFGCLGDAS